MGTSFLVMLIPLESKLKSQAEMVVIFYALAILIRTKHNVIL